MNLTELHDIEKQLEILEDKKQKIKNKLKVDEEAQKEQIVREEEQRKKTYDKMAYVVSASHCGYEDYINVKVFMSLDSANEAKKKHMTKYTYVVIAEISIDYIPYEKYSTLIF